MLKNDCNIVISKLCLQLNSIAKVANTQHKITESLAKTFSYYNIHWKQKKTILHQNLQGKPNSLAFIVLCL